MVLCTQWIRPRSISCRPDQQVKWGWWCGIIELQCSVVIVQFTFPKSSQKAPTAHPWGWDIGCPVCVHIHWYNSNSRHCNDVCNMMLYWDMLKQHPEIYHIHTSMVEANIHKFHNSDVIMSMMASQITSVSLDYLGADQRKHQSSTLPALVRGIHRWPVNSSHKRPVARKILPFDDLIMCGHTLEWCHENVNYGLMWYTVGTLGTPILYFLYWNISTWTFI